MGVGGAVEWGWRGVGVESGGGHRALDPLVSLRPITTLLF